MKFWQVLIILGISAFLFAGWAVAYHYDKKSRERDGEE